MSTKSYISVGSVLAIAYVFLAPVWGVTPSMAQDVKRTAVRAFVTNFGGDDVSVVDPESGR